MIVHGEAGGRRVVRANRTIDLPMCFGGVSEISVSRTRRGLATAFVVKRRHHLDESRDDWIGRTLGHGAMERDVVDEKALGIGHAREEARDFFRHGRKLLRGRSLRREPCRLDLQDSTRFVHLIARKAMQRRKQTERLGSEDRRSGRNVGARSMSRLHDTERSQRAQSCPHRRPAHTYLHRERALGR